MKIKVEYVGYLYLKDVKNNSWLEIDKSITISQLLLKYGMSVEKQKYVIPSVNKKSERLSYILQDNDEIFLYAPVGGG